MWFWIHIEKEKGTMLLEEQPQIPQNVFLICSWDRAVPLHYNQRMLIGPYVHLLKGLSWSLLRKYQSATPLSWHQYRPLHTTFLTISRNPSGDIWFHSQHSDCFRISQSASTTPMCHPVSPKSFWRTQGMFCCWHRMTRNIPPWSQPISRWGWAVSPLGWCVAIERPIFLLQK